MLKPELPHNESARLDNLDSYHILDTLPDEDYDNITTLASKICDTPISLISLIDTKRQWFKSRHGLSASETPKGISFCGHAILDPSKVFEISDASKDLRFHDNPLVTGDPHIAFYAGVPLVTDEGYPLGTLCVIDRKVKTLNGDQINSLKILARQVIVLMNLRRKKFELEHALEEKNDLNKQLTDFAGIAAHDIKAPLSNITAIIEELKENKSINQQGLDDLNLLDLSAQKLQSMVTGLLEYSSVIKNVNRKHEGINFLELLESLKKLLRKSDDITIDLASNKEVIYTNKAGLQSILLNLLTNAVRYNDKDKTVIKIDFNAGKNFNTISFQDNGPGIDPKFLPNVFTLFKVATSRDKFGDNGNGIGLATVKSIIDGMNGTIEVESEPGKGTKFIFTLPVNL